MMETHQSPQPTNVAAAANSAMTEGEPQKLVRYSTLLGLIDKSLSESRKAFETEDAVKECYGDDASMFDGDSSNNVLSSAIDAMVERVHEKVMEEMLQFLERERVQERLAVVETIINGLDRHDDEQKQADDDDRQSAREALEAVRLPNAVLPADVLSYHAYKMMEQERDSLLQEISNVQEETKGLEETMDKRQQEIQDGTLKMQATAVELRKSASIMNQ